MVQVVVLKANLFQSSLISFVCLATLSGKESFQLFEVGIAMFLEGGKCYWCKDYHLVRVHDVYLSFGTHLLFNTHL